MAKLVPVEDAPDQPAKIAGKARLVLVDDDPEKPARMAAQGKPEPDLPGGALEATMISAGRTADKLKQGVSQALLEGRLKLAESMGDGKAVKEIKGKLAQLSGAEEDKDWAFNLLREGSVMGGESYPMATALGAGIPYATPAGGASILGRVAHAGLLGGGIGGMSYGSPSERAGNAAAGVVGNVAGAGLGEVPRLLSGPISGAGSPSMGTVIDQVTGYKTGRRSGILDPVVGMGYKPLPSEIGGSTGWRQTEDYLSRAPGSSGVMSRHAEGNTKALNTAAAESIGEKARTLNPDVLAEAAERIGGAFQAVKELPGRPVALDKDLAKTAAEVLREHSLHPLRNDPQLVKLASNLEMLGTNRGKMSGAAYNALRSDLSDASASAFREGNGSLGQQYQKLLDAVDDSAYSSLRKAGFSKEAESLQKARPEWANLMTLEKGRAVSPSGDINPPILGSVMQSKYGRAYREGGGGILGDIGRFGQSNPPLRPGSQTFERGEIRDIANALVQEARGADAARPNATSLLLAPFNYGAAQAITSTPFRYWASKGLLGQPILSETGGILGGMALQAPVAGYYPGIMQ